MIVIGIMTSPTDARAAAPVARFARFESRGNEDEEGDFRRLSEEGTYRSPCEARILEPATRCRSALRVEK